VAVGEDFTVALGLTLPCLELDRLAKSNGILRLRPDRSSDSKSSKIRQKRRTPSREQNDTRNSGGKIKKIQKTEITEIPLRVK